MFKNSKVHYDSKVNKTDSVIYFNANIYNNPIGTQAAKQARFSQSISSGTVVDLPENYYLAIVRFAISHMLIPLYLFSANFYSVTLRNVGTGVESLEVLNYVTAGAGYSQYGYTNPIFYYHQLVTMINNALTAAYDNLVTPANQRSFFYYDPITERFQFYLNVNDPTEIYMNANLFQQLQLFPSEFQGYNTTNSKDYKLVPVLAEADINKVTLDGNDYYINTQERSALYLLNQVQSIVFTSNTLSVTKEYVGRNDGSGTAGSVPILADFVPDQSTGRDLSEYQYNVQGPPRLVNLTNTIPITDIDYQVGIRFRDGTIVPLYLEPGETCEVKFGFFKKSLYDNNFEY